MLRTFITSLISLSATTAFAHPGHIESVGSHSHYVGFGALIIAAAIVAGLIVKTKRARNV